MIVICDESGAKGYSNQKEKYPGEFGLFAGYVLKSDSQLEKIESELSNIFNEIEWPENQKKHLSNLNSELAEKIRCNVFKIFKENEIICMYSAIYVDGFYSSNNEIKETKNKIKELVTSNIEVTKHYEEESLHVALFQNLFLKIISLYEERKEDKNLLIILDNVDNWVKRQLNSAKREVLEISNEQTIKVVGSDKKDRSKIYTGKIEIKPKIPEEYKIKINPDKIKLEKNIRPSLIFAADVLSNSLYNCFSDLNKSIPGISLNSFDKLEIHGYDYFYLINDSYLDMLYKRPEKI